MWIVIHRKFFYTISGVLVVVAFIAMGVFGLNLGIDFTGGSLTQVLYTMERPDKAGLEERLATLTLGGYSLRPAGERGYILRTRDLSDEERVAVLSVLSRGGEAPFATESFNSIGPTIGSELRNKSLAAIALVILAIVLFVAFAFRKVSKPVSSWRYGFIAIVALLHDVIIPTGTFAFLGYFFGLEIDALFVTALLVILGFSVHDTIVVFDRVRENLRVNAQEHKNEEFSTTVGKSIAQTFNRSINTSLTTVITLFALYFFGPESTESFSLALLIGIIAGTYSSIFLGSPLLVTVERWQRR